MKKKLIRFFRFFLINLIIIVSLSMSISLITPIDSYLQILEDKPLNSQPFLNTTLADEFNSSFAYNNIETQLSFGDRIPGSNGSFDCAKNISSEMQKYGESALYNFSINGFQCNNIISRINPNKSQIVIFASHYDSRAVAEKDPNSSLRSEPIDGANDGGSGVAVMMEMARVIAEAKINWNVSFWFVFFDAEDQGESRGISGINGWDWCEGSEWMVEEMENQPNIYFREGQSLDTIHSFILFDMVGGTNLKFIRESHSNDDLTDEVFKIGNSLGYEVNFPLNGATRTYIDDHVPFAQKGIPTLDLIIEFDNLNCGWPYHHTSGDTIENISEESLEITGRTALQYVYETFDPTLGFIEKFSSKETFFSNPYVIGTGILIIGVGIAIVIKSTFFKKY
ncbi:M28 family peptidase [Promethearchaeum syntrophicum]|uniref:M28 family peptidase n=1 Tax=Promethearchaeum syntrophicum TaxID=2594042 RepID=A0A5B9DCP6_9ARCH|nr:M28 family peptidase [Candidatus Prometheoarchaeum syntrophicum]QEE16533.1 Peptidase family M28 [Candidatus Prometheoarchaeum syntrophicum]